MNPAKVRSRLEALATSYQRKWAIKLNEHVAKHAGERHGRAPLEAVRRAIFWSDKAVLALAKKYLNRCAVDHEHPEKFIEIYRSVAENFLQGMKAEYDRRHSDGAFGSRANERALFAKEFEETSKRLEEAIDDVLHGEIQTDVIYRYTSPVRRWWDDWGKAFVLALFGGLLAGAVNFVITTAKENAAEHRAYWGPDH